MSVETNSARQSFAEKNRSAGVGYCQENSTRVLLIYRIIVMSAV